MISQEFKEPEFGSVVFQSLFLEILWAHFFGNTFQTVELFEILKYEKKIAVFNEECRVRESEKLTFRLFK